MLSWLRRRFRPYRGGSIGGPIFPSEPIPLGKGVAVVPDAILAKYGRDYLEKLNGGDSTVLSASEAVEGLRVDE